MHRKLYKKLYDTIGITNTLEVIQNNFLTFLSFRFHLNRNRHSVYEVTLSYFNIFTLQ